MYIFSRRTFTAFLVFALGLSTCPVKAQQSQEQRERFEAEREEHQAELATVPLQRQQLPITTVTKPVAPPVVVNFTERAQWDLAHPHPHAGPKNNEEKDHDFKIKPMAIRPDAKIATLPRTAVAPAGNNAKAGTNSPAPILNVNGVMGQGSVVPPDITAATGINYEVEITNQELDIFNKINGAVVSQVDLNTFFNFNGGNTNFLSDPHIMYDAIHGRFIAVIDAIIVGSTGTFLLAVSQTTDPTGNWYIYTLNGANNDITDNQYSVLLDFPILGFNQNWIVVSGNQFNGNAATVADIFVVNRASCYAGTLGSVTHFSDANSFCISPAHTMDTTTLTEWLVQDANGNSNGTGYVQIGSITGPVGTPVYNAGTQLGIAQPWNENAVEATQKGTNTTINADDTRISCSQFINGSLWFAHSAWLPATGNTPTYSAADWWQVNPAALTVTQFGRITDGSSYYYYPNIYANVHGDALVGYTISSGSEYATAAYSFHAAGDVASTMENIYTYKSGIAVYDQDRWGDYSSASVDPVDSSFWIVQGWANSGDTWGTQIAHVGSSAPVTRPPVASFTANVTTSCTGIIQFTDFSTNAPTAWLWNFGDGTTSTLQNPTHTYTTNGTFTVTLKATNPYGNNSVTQTSYITINEPAGPTATGASHCPGNTFSLSASTSNPVKWFDSTGNVISTANPFVTPALSHTTTYYVQDSVLAPTDVAGPASYTSLGTYAYLTPNFGLTFDVLQPATLQSVYVNANAAGAITVFVQNSGGTTVASANVNVPAGSSRITLNFSLPVGTGYVINYSGNIQMYRNSAGAVYPYTDANGYVRITGNNVGGSAPAYYYFFYDWFVGGIACNSQATPVTATVTNGISLGTPTITNATCYGAATGAATVTPTGGTPTYTYSWSNSQTGATLTGVAAGTYTVSIHDAAGCSATASETITQPTAINISVTPVGAPCSSANGSATAAVSGGTAGYTYLWSNTQTTITATGLVPATYTLTVTDSHSCTATATTSVVSSGALSLAPASVSATCFGTLTGTASVVETGGSGNITYHWSNGGTAASITNVAAATYLVTVSDANGCSGTTSTTVSQPTALNVSVTAINSGCGSPNGSASAAVTGGTAGYHYLWSNTATTGTITGLSAATYNLVVTDNNQCTAASSATIANTGLLNVAATPGAPVCSGAATGTASATISGGTGPFNYHWSTGATASSITGVLPGSYQVTAADNTGCTGTASATIAASTTLSASASAINVSCFNAGNGTASVNVTSGTTPYNYAWSNGLTTASITGLNPGSYITTVTDGNSCQTIDSVAVTQPDAITIFVSTVEPTCAGAGNGTASVTATGGTPGFSYAWSNSSTAIGINGLTAGGYSVTLTDTHSCSSSTTFNITDPAAVTATVVPTGDSCFNTSTGSIAVTGTGGTAPYTYLWANSSTASSITGLAAGSYSVTITDAHNCTLVTNGIVNEPSAIVDSTTSTDATNGQANGSASVVTVTGGRPPYQVTWSNGTTANNITGLTAGNYTATITDANGCQATTAVEVNLALGIAPVNNTLTFSIYPNPAKTEVTISAANLDKETTLVLQDVLGQTLVSKVITSSATSINLSGYSNGVYFIQLIQQGKSAVKKFVINR